MDVSRAKIVLDYYSPKAPTQQVKTEIKGILEKQGFKGLELRWHVYGLDPS